MKPSTVETLVWVLVYAGLLSLCLGHFVPDDAMRLVLQWGGGTVAAVGALLIWVRSRMSA